MKKRVAPMSFTRRSFLTTTSAALAAGLLNPARVLAQAQDLQTSFEAVRGDVGIFLGRGGTIGWMVTPEAAVVIDSQFPETAQICLNGLNEKTGNRPIDFLINTHHHGDHTAGNGTFRASVKKIVAHENVPKLQKAAARGPESEQVYADTTFAETWKADLGAEVVSAKYYGAAHTSGDITIHFEKANVVHVGDLMFNRRHPYIDRPAGASISGWIKILEQIVADHSDDTIFIFGHAGDGWQVTGGSKEIFHHRDYLTALLAHVEGEIKAGKSKDEIINAAVELKGFSEHGPLIPRVLTPAYDELTA